MLELGVASSSCQKTIHERKKKKIFKGKKGRYWTHYVNAMSLWRSVESESSFSGLFDELDVPSLQNSESEMSPQKWGAVSMASQLPNAAVEIMGLWIAKDSENADKITLSCSKFLSKAEVSWACRFAWRFDGDGRLIEGWECGDGKWRLVSWCKTGSRLSGTWISERCCMAVFQSDEITQVQWLKMSLNDFRCSAMMNF